MRAYHVPFGGALFFKKGLGSKINFYFQRGGGIYYEIRFPKRGSTLDMRHFYFNLTAFSEESGERFQPSEFPSPFGSSTEYGYI
jgi:hypothetical protein